MREIEQATLKLTVPNDPTYLRLVRLVVASSAADLAFSYDAIEDLRIIADELTNLVMMVSVPGSAVNIGIFPGQEFFEFRSSALKSTLDHAGSYTPLENGAEPIALDLLAAQIVASLVDSYQIESRDGRIEVCFSVRCPIGPPDG